MKIAINEPNISKEECAGSLKHILDALYVLNGKWKLALILCLVQSSKRFNEIQHDVTGISPKVLAKELKDLEGNKLVKRTVYDSFPPVVEYCATEHTQTLNTVIFALKQWGYLHRKKITGR